MAAQQVQIQVVRELNQNWLECVDDQGLYYFNKETQECLDQMPAEAAQPMQQMQQMQQPQQPMQQMQQMQQPQQVMQQDTMQQAMQQAPPQRKMIIGAWSVMEDAQGVFFHNGETQQQSAEVPPEIAQIFAKVTYAAGGQMVLPTAQPSQPQMFQSQQPQQASFLPQYQQPIQQPMQQMYQAAGSIMQPAAPQQFQQFHMQVPQQYVTAQQQVFG